MFSVGYARLRVLGVTCFLSLSVLGCGSSGGSDLLAQSQGGFYRFASGPEVGGGQGGPITAGPGTGSPETFGPGGGALNASPPSGIVLAAPGGIGLEIGESSPLAFVVNLEDGTAVAVNSGVNAQSVSAVVDGVRLEYESLDHSIASVDAKALVTGLKTGSTKVRIKATSGQGEAQSTIELEVPVLVGQAQQFFYIASPTPNGSSGWLTILGIYLDGSLKVIEDRISQDGRPLGVFRSPDGRFIYAVNVSSNDITAYAVTQGTGFLTRLGENIPVAEGSHPRGLAFTPDQQYAYTAGAYGQLYGYSVGPDGRLTPLPHSLPDVATLVRSLVVRGNHLYVVDVDASPGRVRVCEIASDGSVTYQSEALGVGRTFGFDFSADGRYAYLGTEGTELSLFSVEENGDLEPLNPATLTTTTAPTVVKAHPTLPILYVGTDEGDVTTYSIDSETGSLTELAKDESLYVSSLVIDLTGQYMYGFRGDYILATFRIAADGRLTRGEDFDDRSIDRGFAGTGVFVNNTLNRAVKSLFDEDFSYSSVIGF